jgi:hypothetical protein
MGDFKWSKPQVCLALLQMFHCLQLSHRAFKLTARNPGKFALTVFPERRDKTEHQLSLTQKIKRKYNFSYPCF